MMEWGKQIGTAVTCLQTRDRLRQNANHGAHAPLICSLLHPFLDPLHFFFFYFSFFSSATVTEC